MIVEVSLGIGFAGVRQEDEIEIPDGLTEDEIYEYCMDWAHEYIDLGYTVVEG